MNIVKTLLKENKTILIPYLFLLILGVVFVGMYAKNDIHLWLNQFHTPFFDLFFKYTTFLGDGVFVLFIGLIALTFYYKLFYQILISAVATTIITQFLKLVVFASVVRPSNGIGVENLHIIEGVKMHGRYSFPSGHTTAAFMLFMSLIFYIRNTKIKIALFTIAVLAGYSRVYLSQHYLIDIIAGSIIGTAISIVVYYWLATKRNAHLNKGLFFNRK